MWRFGSDTWAQSKQLFADQFEPYSNGQFLYRKSQKGPPIPVTADERIRFIEDYARRLRYCTWGMVLGILLFVVITIWWTFQADSDFPDAAGYVGMVAIAVVGVAYVMWVQSAPARELARRSPVGGERTPMEMRRRILGKTSYGQLAGLAFVGAILPFTLRSRPDVLHGWGRLWLLYAAAIVLLAAITAFRKWRFERDDQDGRRY